MIGRPIGRANPVGRVTCVTCLVTTGTTNMNIGSSSQPTDFALDVFGRYVCTGLFCGRFLAAHLPASPDAVGFRRRRAVKVCAQDTHPPPTRPASTTTATSTSSRVNA